MAGLTESHRDILRLELEDAERERERLDAAIVYLRRRLGLAEGDSGGDTDDAGSTARVDPKGEVAEAINPGRFFGFTASRAAIQVLEMVGPERPLRTIEIFRAIQAGGVTLKDPEALARALKRNKAFHRVGRGLWGLRQWYPATAREWAPGAGEPDDDLSGEIENGDDEGEKQEDG